MTHLLFLNTKHHFLLIPISTIFFFFFFFFLMIRRPPRSTLFPTRRSSDLDALLDRSRDAVRCLAVAAFQINRHRSEEHTSELQSPVHLVCRLLLEKKKKKTKMIPNYK